KPFVPVPPAELSVYDAEHPRPKDATGVEGTRKWLTQQSEKQMAALTPKDPTTLVEYQRVVGTALKAMAGGYPGGKGEVVVHEGPKASNFSGFEVHQAIFGRRGESDRIAAIGLIPKEGKGTVAIWIHPKGKASLFENGKLAPAVKELLDK